jgi:signal transduction histidine kinase
VRFYALAAIVRRQWGAELDVRLDPLGPSLSKAFRREIHRLVREAVFNAAKHSGASRIVVEGGSDRDEVRLVIKDDGRGFPFVGRFDLDTLNQMKVGPTTLKERVSAMGGQLTILSSNHGSEVEIRIPTASGVAA